MDLHNQLLVTEHGVSVIRNRTLSSLLKWMSIPVVLLCTLFCLLFITRFSTPWRFLSIPAAAAFALYYMAVFAGVGRKSPETILEINSGVLRRFAPAVQVPLNSVTRVEDQSFYYDFEGNGPSGKGWQHRIEIRYTENDAEKICVLSGLGLSHPDHLRLTDFLRDCLNGRISG